jgi:hypothetical protein
MCWMRAASRSGCWPKVARTVGYDTIGNVINDGPGACTCDLRKRLLEQPAAEDGPAPEAKCPNLAWGFQDLATSLVAGRGSADWLLEPGREMIVETTSAQSCRR